MTRRQFVRSGAALGAGAAISPALLAACGSSSSTSSTGASGKQSIKIAIDATPSTFDPATDGGPDQTYVYFAINDGLTRWRLTDGPQPGSDSIAWTANPSDTVGRMAQSWSVDSTHTQYTFHLRQGWLSHHGNELTSADVAWTFDRTMHITGIGSSLNELTNIKSVNPVSKYVVQFVLSAPSPSFPVDLNDFAYRCVLDATEAKKYASSSDPWAQKWISTNDAGFGPFKLTNFVPGQQMEFEAAAGHPFPPKTKQLLMTVAPEASSRLSLLANGAVDMAVLLTPTELKTLHSMSGVTVWNFENNGIVGLPLNVKSAPFNDVRVRQALAYAVPYESLVSDVYLGYARPAYGPLPSASAGLVDESLFPYKLDYSKAKALLKAAGYGSGFTTTYSYEAADDIEEQVGLQLRSSFAEIGVKLNLQGLAESVYSSNLYSGKFDVIYTDLGGDIPDPQYTLPLFYGTGGAANFNSYDSSAVNGLIKQGLTMTDSTQQFDFYRTTISKAIIEDVPWLWLVQPGYQVATRTNVAGVTWYEGGSLWDPMHIT